MQGMRPVFLVYIGSHLTSSPPHGIMMISSVLETQGQPTRLFDLAATPRRRQAFLDACKHDSPLWIGFTCLTPEMPFVTQLIREVRSCSPETPVGIGGIHASILPELSMEETGADFVLIGEAEDRIVRLTEMIDRKKLDHLSDLPGVGIWRKDRFELSEGPTDRPDIALLPMPNWKGIDINDYRENTWQLISKYKPVAPVITSRGCPYHCRFCAVSRFMGKKIRKRNPEQVLDEIAWLKKDFHVREIQIADDNFSADLNHAKTILSGMIQRDFGLVWKSPIGIRIDIGDREWISLLKRSGCYQIGFGIESGVEEILLQNRKQLDIRGIRETLQAYKDAGISTFGYFVIGLPGDTEETINRTIRFACSLPLDHIHASFCIPFPGSSLYDEMSTQGRAHHRWEEYREYRIFPMTAIPKKTLTNLMRKFYFRFYSKPVRALRLFKEAFFHIGPLKLLRVFRAYMGLNLKEHPL